MPDDLPHLAWPYRLGATVEQDTDDADLAAAATIVATPRGHRDDDPSFGVTVPVFDTTPVDTDRLAREIAQSGGLSVDTDQVLDIATRVATVRVSTTTA